MTLSRLAPLGLFLACANTPEGLVPGECTDDIDNDGDGIYDCADPDCTNTSECVSTTPGTGVGGGTPGGNTSNPGLFCEFDGTSLRLANVTCDGQSAMSEWTTMYTDSRLTLTDDGTGFGHCTMTIRVESPTCIEEEQFRLAFGDSNAQIWFEGVSFCEPSSCTHTVNHEKCIVGTRLFGGPNPRTITGSGGGITITDLFGYQLPSCSGSVSTDWTQ